MPFPGRKTKVGNDDDAGEEGNDQYGGHMVLEEDREEDVNGFGDDKEEPVPKKASLLPESESNIITKNATTPEQNRKEAVDGFDDDGVWAKEEPEEPVPRSLKQYKSKRSFKSLMIPESTPENHAGYGGGGDGTVPARAILAVGDKDRDGDRQDDAEGTESKERRAGEELPERSGGRLCTPFREAVFSATCICLIISIIAIMLGLHFGNVINLFPGNVINNNLLPGMDVLFVDTSIDTACDLCEGRGGNLTEDRRLTFLLGESTNVTCGNVEALMLYSAKRLYQAKEGRSGGNSTIKSTINNSTIDSTDSESGGPTIESVCHLAQRFGVYCGCNSFSEYATARAANWTSVAGGKEEEEEEDGRDGADTLTKDMEGSELEVEDCTLCGGLETKVLNPSERTSGADLAIGTGLKPTCGWWDEYALRAHERGSGSCVDSVLMASDVCRCSVGTSPPASARPTPSPVEPTPTPTAENYCDLCGGRGGFDFSNDRDLSFVPLLSEAQVVIDVTTCGKLRENYDVWYRFVAIGGDLGLCRAVQELGTYCGCNTPAKRAILDNLYGSMLDFRPCKMCNGISAPLNPESVVNDSFLGIVMGFDPTCSFLHEFVLPLYSDVSEKCTGGKDMADMYCNCPGDVMATWAPTPSPVDVPATPSPVDVSTMPSLVDIPVPVCRGTTTLYGLFLTTPPGGDGNTDSTSVSFEISLQTSSEKKKRGKRNKGGNGGGNDNNTLLRRRMQGKKNTKKNAQDAAKEGAIVLNRGEFGVGGDVHYMCLPAYRCLLFRTSDAEDGARTKLGGIGWELHVLLPGGSLHPGPPPPRRLWTVWFRGDGC